MKNSVAELSLKAIILGVFLALLMCAANTYLGLYAGMTVSASIPAAVISMAILRGIFRRGTILENNIAQTAASAGESLAAGIIFTIPALVILGAWRGFNYWTTTLIAILGGSLGVLFMIPLRKALIVEEKELTYPEGIACAEVLKTGQEKGRGIEYLLIALAIGAVFKFCILVVSLIKGTVEGGGRSGRTIRRWPVERRPEYGPSRERHRGNNCRQCAPRPSDKRSPPRACPAAGSTSAAAWRPPRPSAA